MLRKSAEDSSYMVAYLQSQHWEAEARIQKFKVTFVAWATWDHVFNKKAEGGGQKV